MGGSHAEMKLTDWLHWLAIQSLGSCWVHLPVDNSAPHARIAGAHFHVSYLCGCWRPTLRFSRLLRKYFTCGAISWAENSAAFLHVSNEQSENNVEEANLFTTASRRTKILRVHLTKEVQELLHDSYVENCLNQGQQATIHRPELNTSLCCREFQRSCSRHVT